LQLGKTVLSERIEELQQHKQQEIEHRGIRTESVYILCSVEEVIRLALRTLSL
jgi:hypothetical protein